MTKSQGKSKKRKKPKEEMPSRRRAAVHSWLGKYVFSRDHRTVALQHLVSAPIWFAIASLMASSLRLPWSFPWSNAPVIARLPYTGDSWQVSPELSQTLMILFATAAGLFLVLPILWGTLGNRLFPPAVAADKPALPTLGAMAYWLMWPAFFCMGLSCLAPGTGAFAGRESFPPPAIQWDVAPASRAAITWWLTGVLLVWVSATMSSVNYLATLTKRRGDMPKKRGLVVVVIVQTAVLAGLMIVGLVQQCDVLFDTRIILPGDLFVTDSMASHGGGQPLVWHHLFWLHAKGAIAVVALSVVAIVRARKGLGARGEGLGE